MPMTSADDAPRSHPKPAENQVDPYDATERSLAFHRIDSIALDAVGAGLAPKKPVGRFLGTGDGDPSMDQATTRESDHQFASNRGPMKPGEADPMIGRQIGPYQVTERIGGGTVGTVYRARHVADCTQQIAVKLIKRGNSDSIARRFQAEIHLQAALGKHPHITPLLDLGMTEDGQPYFVMEYIDGQRIDGYCDICRLDVRARLKLFSQVCAAVHFAHQHAVIHGNLKPSNILVTADGIPKLINFGIVRLVHLDGDAGYRDQTADSVSLIGSQEHVYALEFTSPEQVEGGPVTTTSDVYALGVVLYLLLTGRGPYYLGTGCTSEILQAICEQVPEKPSSSVVRRKTAGMGSTGSTPANLTLPDGSSPESVPVSTTTHALSTLEDLAQARGQRPRRLKQILTGDLDAIVLMALRKEPGCRYASVEHLADDIHRYLEGMPVKAHRDSAAAWTVRFIRRHRTPFIVSSFLILAFMAGIVGTTIGMIVARRQNSRAESSFLQARESINQLWTRVSEERLLDQPGLQPLRKALLQDVRRFYEDFLKRYNGDRSLQAELASASSKIARAFSSVTGSTTDAIKQFEQAIARWDHLVATQPANLVYREMLARTLSKQGSLLMNLEGRRDEALRVFHRAQTLIEPLVADSRSIKAEHELAIVYLNIAEIEHAQGSAQRAIESIQRSLTIESKQIAQDQSALDSLILIARGRALLGQILVTQPDESEQALTEFQQAVELLEKVDREHPELSDQALRFALVLGDLSTLEQMTGKLDSALASALKALEISERLERQYPDVLNYERCLAVLITCSVTHTVTAANRTRRLCLPRKRKPCSKD